MRTISLNTGWRFGPGLVNFGAMISGKSNDRPVTLPHDYMIESDVYPEAPSGAASGYFNAGVAHYIREIDIPADWAEDRIALRFDGAMMNATVEVNGDKVCLQHYGYAPFEADITRFVYPGRKNLVVITVNPSMQPNSRWYSGAGLFRGVSLTHTPKLAVAFGGLAGSTAKIEYGPDGTPETAYLKVSADIRNDFAENRVAEVAFDLLREGTEEAVRTSKTLVQVPALSTATAYMTLTVDQPLLWDAENPNLYCLRARVKDAGTYKTHIIPSESAAEDAESVLFGIRTVEADVKHGLRINGKEVKLRGGCLHHDNGVIGTVTCYDAEARKVSFLKSVGFNAVRTTHNPPSAALIEACDRLGMYVFDEAFDAWGMGKQPGDYNQFFETDCLRAPGPLPSLRRHLVHRQRDHRARRPGPGLCLGHPAGGNRPRPRSLPPRVQRHLLLLERPGHRSHDRYAAQMGGAEADRRPAERGPGRQEGPALGAVYRSLRQRPGRGGL